jgi:diguanylate cyclase (GGDEF)-like protein
LLGLLTFGTAVVSGVQIAALRRRMAELVARLEAATRTDPLTGLFNRRAFRELFDHELERARRAERSLSVVVGDLDNFRQINDRLGYDAGDRALVRVADRVRAGKRRIDVAARTGGEQFAVLMPETGLRASLLAAERLRADVRRGLAEESVPLTISFGVASFPQQGATVEQLLHAADRALYAAKELGRDRSVVYSAEVDKVLAASGALGSA